MSRIPPDWIGAEPLRGYPLVEVLTRTDHGTVFTADDPNGRRVRLAVYDLHNDPNSRKLCRRIGLARSLAHPNLATPVVARVVDCRRRESDIADVTEATFRGPPKLLCVVWDGPQGTLEDRLRQANPDFTPEANRVGVPVRDAVSALQGGAAALDFLADPHRGSGPAGAVVHGDIRPATIFHGDGRVSVGDYWAGCVLGAVPEVRLSGRPVYSSPEVFANKPSSASDQYSLAITYFELRTGRLPFPDDTSLLEVIVAQLRGELEFRTSVLAEGESDALRRATSVAPADRFPTCGDFAAAVGAATDAAA